MEGKQHEDCQQSIQQKWQGTKDVEFKGSSPEGMQEKWNGSIEINQQGTREQGLQKTQRGTRGKVCKKSSKNLVVAWNQARMYARKVTSDREESQHKVQIVTAHERVKEKQQLTMHECKKGSKELGK